MTFQALYRGWEYLFVLEASFGSSLVLMVVYIVVTIRVDWRLFKLFHGYLDLTDPWQPVHLITLSFEIISSLLSGDFGIKLLTAYHYVT